MKLNTNTTMGAAIADALAAHPSFLILIAQQTLTDKQTDLELIARALKFKKETV